MKNYLETFDNGPGGWWGWGGNDKGLKPLEIKNGAVISRSPWWIDYNHAPPGAGYIHMVFSLNTKGPFGEHLKDVGGPNGFVGSGCSRDFTNAKMTARIKGELIENGAKLVLLIQAAVGEQITGWMLTGQPFRVTPDWSEQTITLVPDERQWTCLGARHDRGDYYNRSPLKTILGNVNVNIMLVMFPLDVAPMGLIEGDPHRLRPERDYPVWRSRLPEGYVMLDTMRIDFP
ncbi:MAG: hypothetical protein HY360_03835 [Verrucomicrobia bacterium]|nr:hypothetical protein [Verrucomicrobiota bacterium]